MLNKDIDIPHLNLKSIETSTKNENIDTKRSLATNMNTNRYHLMKTYLTKQILQHCLENFDIFKQINEDPVLKRKLIKDVLKIIIIKIYDEQGVIFNKGQNSQSMYMVIKGSVSLCLPIFKENQNKENVDEGVDYQYKEINIYSKGDGFGQAEFIVRKKRGLMARAKENNTVIGVIQCNAFEQIIQNFRNRDYLKKMDMFSQCPLLNQLQRYALQFIVNNSKLIIFPIFKQIALQNDIFKGIYLITSGQIQLKKSCSQHKPSLSKYYSHQSNSDVEKIKLNNIQIGILEAGQFLGDTELALGIPYGYTATAKSQKVRAYACDQRIIMSQMNQQAFNNAKKYYQDKYHYHQNKERIYKTVKSKLQKQIERDEKNILNKAQIKLKRRITNRYVEKVPTLIGQLSPRQIEIIVNKKYLKIKTQPGQINDNTFAHIQILKKDKKLKANSNYYSPYLKKMQQQKNNKRKYSEQDQVQLNDFKRPYLTNMGPVNTLKLPATYTNSEAKITFPFVTPLKNKAFKVYDTLIKQYSRNRMRSQINDIQRNELILSLQPRSNRRLDEFKANIKKYKDKSSIMQQYKAN